MPRYDPPEGMVLERTVPTPRTRINIGAIDVRKSRRDGTSFIEVDIYPRCGTVPFRISGDARKIHDLFMILADMTDRSDSASRRDVL